jgi:hypothetical protein
VKLGKQPPRRDGRTLRLATYLRAALPTPPDAVAWSEKVKDWSLYANHLIGDCTVATAGNLVQCWSANGQSKEVEPPEWLVVATYTHLAKFDPQDPTTDRGLVVLDVLKHWRKRGVGRHKIEAFAEIDPKRLDEVRAGLWLFGGLYAGLALPDAWENQLSVWSTGRGQAYQPGSWGGHAVPVADYGPEGVTVVTWGGTRRVTWAAWQKYAEECFVCIAPEFLLSGRAPNGFDASTLRADLKKFHSPG